MNPNFSYSQATSNIQNFTSNNRPADAPLPQNEYINSLLKDFQKQMLQIMNEQLRIFYIKLNENSERLNELYSVLPIINE